MERDMTTAVMMEVAKLSFFFVVVVDVHECGMS